MAKLEGNDIAGKIGDLVYYKMNGSNIVRSKPIRRKKPKRSHTQQATRTDWGNMVQLWKRFPKGFAPYFEDKMAGQRDYNQFLGRNKETVHVYLTQEMNLFAACIMAPYLISSGSLESIETRVRQGIIVSNIRLGDLQISSQTTVKEFSYKVLQLNSQFKEGDEIVYYIGLQYQNKRFPSITIRCFAIKLNISDQRSIFMDPLMADFLANIEGFLGCRQRVEGGMCWVHRREDSLGMHVSSQNMVCTNALYDKFSTSQALMEAVESYKPKGGDLKKDLFYQEIEEMKKDEVTRQEKEIVVRGNPEEGGMIQGAGRYTVGSRAQIIAVANHGYTFDSWEDGSLSPIRMVVVNEDMNLEARFKSV